MLLYHNEKYQSIVIVHKFMTDDFVCGYIFNFITQVMKLNITKGLYCHRAVDLKHWRIRLITFSVLSILPHLALTFLSQMKKSLSHLCSYRHHLCSLEL